MFRTGSQCGLKPDEVLDLSFDEFDAVVKGYSDRLFDMQTIAVQAGYWAGYYSRAKKPKALNRIIESIVRARKKADSRARGEVTRPDVDVEAFLATEKSFKEKFYGN